MGASVVYEQVVARRLDPLDSGVISVTYMHAGNTNNVIPSEVKVGGTYRALTHTTFAWLQEQVCRVRPSVRFHKCKQSESKARTEIETETETETDSGIVVTETEN